MSRVYLSPPHMGEDERRLLVEAFDSNWIAPLGPHVDAFEREFAVQVGASHAVALSSGTAGLHLSLKLLGVGSGDEVLVSSLTFSASANPITYLGATPVFIDAEERSWNLDPNLVEDALRESASRGKLPKALIAVDLYGQCADYDALQAICGKYEVPILEDAAESLGATYRGKSAGVFGALGVFSFNGNKIITTSGGGMVVSENKTFIDKIRHLSTQAREPAPHYQHNEIGYNYRLSNLLAAVGRGQLKALDSRVEARRANNAFYRSAFKDVRGIEFMPEADFGRSNGWLTCITLEPSSFGTDRETVRQMLEKNEIESRPVWKPMHLQPVFSGCRIFGGSVAERLFAKGLCLPSGSSLTPEDRARVVELILSASSAKRLAS